MADNQYPAVGLQVDLDDFATLKRAVDGGVEDYARLRKAAVESTKVDAGDVDRVAQRRARAMEAATNAQLMGSRQILAAQRGLTNFQLQQDAQVLRSRQNLATQQAREAEKGARAEVSAQAASLRDFRRMMAERIAAGRAAADAENKQAQDTFAVRKRMTAQQASDYAKVQREREAFALKAAKTERDAERQNIAQFRKMMDERIEAGRAAARAQQRIDEQTYQTRRRLTAQQIAQAAKDQRAQITRTPAPMSGGNVAGGIFAGLGNAAERFARPFTALRSTLAATRSAIFDVRTAVAVFLGGLVLGPIVRFTDQMTALEARIGFFAKSSKDVPYLFEAVYEAAQRSRAPLEAVGSLYTRLAPLADQLGKSQLELLRVTETVQKGIAIGGATAAEAAASSQQLAQALASNRLGGDELRSLAENAPVLLGAIAKELNMNTGQFIKWAHAGKANAEVIVGALERAAPRIDKLFSQFPVTIGQGITVVTNAFAKFVGEVNRSTQIGATVGAALVDFSKFIEADRTITATANALMLLGDAFKFIGDAVGVLIAGLPAIGAALVVVAARTALASKGVQSLAFNFALLSAVVGRNAAAMIVAQNAVAVSSARMAAAVRGAFAFFGGPIGVAVIAAATAFSMFADSQRKAAAASQDLQDSQEGSINALDRAIAFADAYGVSNTNLSMTLDSVVRGSSQAAQEAYAGVDANDTAGQAAVRRAERERLLAVNILRRARADAQARGADAQGAVDSVFGLKNQSNVLKAAAESAGNLNTTAGDQLRATALREASKKDREIQRLRNAARDEFNLVTGLAQAETEILTAKLDITTPAARGTGGGQGAAEGKVDKAAQNRAASLARELEAMKATAQGNLELAKAFEVSEAAALRQQAAVEATGRAIKRRGDVDAFVAAQMNVNAAEAAAAAAKDVMTLNQRIAAQKVANDSVRSGTTTSQAAADQMAINLELSTMQAQADAASGEVQEFLIRKLGEKRTALMQVNDVEREAQLLADRAAQRDDTALLQREIELIGADTRARAVNLAMLQKEQELKARGQDKLPGAQQAIQDAGKNAGLQVDLDRGLDAYNDKLTLQLDLLRQVDDAAQSAARGMADAFGSVGAALGDVLTVMTEYQVKQEAIAVAKEEYVKRGGNDAQRLAMFERDAANAQLQSYGDLAGAAKGLFAERSRGYKVMEAAEKAFRLFEFAMSAKSIAIQTFETAAKVGLFGTQAAAAAGAGAAAIFASLGPLGFPVVAAMVAVLGGLGVALAGGGGGGVPGANDMQNRQASQGAGSVLGDASAKSESLSRSLEIVAANSNKDLEYSNSMLRALQSIETGIGAVAAALGRSLATGGALSTDGLNLGKVSSGGATSGQSALFTVLGGAVGLAITKILPGLFGSTTTRSLQDQGLQFGSQSVAGILSGGIDGQTYQQVLETTKKKAFGVTYSNKSKSITSTADLDADFSNQVSQLVGSLRGAVIEGAKILGIDGAAAVLDAFEVNLGTLSFKDMDGTQIQEALSSIFGKLGDNLALTAIPALGELQKVGEGAFETLARVARNYQVLDTSLKSIGMSFGTVGIASLQAREYLIDLAGGIDVLTDQISYFSENFLTDLERMAPIQKAVTDELARLGIQGVTTKDQFKNLVLGLDLSSKAGADMYAALLNLAPAFAKLVDFSAAGSQAVQEARDVLNKAYERERDAITATIDKLSKLAETLRDFGDSLSAGPLSGAGLMETTERTRRDFMRTAATAATGDMDAAAALPNLGQAFLEASKQTSATLVDYQRDVATVRNAVRAAQLSAENQITVAEQQLEALNASVSGLIVLNETTISVRDAIINLQAALAKQAAVITPPPVQQPGGGTGGGGTQQPPPVQPPAMQNDWNAYINQYGDVAAEYARNLASSKGRALLAQLGIDSGAEFGEYHYNASGKGEGRNVPQMPLVRTAAEARALGGANDNALTATQLGDINSTMADLKVATEQNTVSSNTTARILKKWDGDGQPEVRNYV